MLPASKKDNWKIVKCINLDKNKYFINFAS